MTDGLAAVLAAIALLAGWGGGEPEPSIARIEPMTGGLAITLTPSGLDRARGRAGARRIAAAAAAREPALRPWVQPELSGEIRAHALAHALGLRNVGGRDANPVNVVLSDYRDRVGDFRWRSLG